MKNYLVLVEAEEYINVNAESEDAAVEQAIMQAQCGLSEWTGTVMHAKDVEE